MTDRDYFTELKEPYRSMANAICKHALEGKSPVDEPIAVMTIGIPGSGKTGLVHSLAAKCEGNRISDLKNKLHSMMQEADFAPSSWPVPKTEFADAVIIDSVGYREMIAKAVLTDRGITDFGEAYKTTAMGRLMEVDKPAADEVWKVGSQIALELLFTTVKERIPCVLDSTGGGFAAGTDRPIAQQVTAPLLELAQASHTQLYFIKLDASLDEAKARVKADKEAGRKPIDSPAQIEQDVARCEAAKAQVLAQAKERKLPVTLIELDPRMRVNAAASHLAARNGNSGPAAVVPGQTLR